MAKVAVFELGECLKLILGHISHLQMSKNAKNLDFRAAKMVKMAVFETLRFAKFDFT